MTAAIIVNGEEIPGQFVEMELKRLETHPDFQGIADEAERKKRLRTAAEDTAINRMLMAQAASRDPRPIPEAEIQREMDSFRRQNGTHATFDEAILRGQMEARLRLRRTIDEIRRQAPDPSEGAVRATYEQHRDTFRQPERVHAAHIVKHTAEGLSEPAAKAGIEAALAELEKGVPFPEVADRYSDCSGKGGDIGWFARGAMVEEFEEVVFGLPVGGRSGIFQTPMGYHIAMVHERREASELDFEGAKAKVSLTLKAWHEHEALRLATLRLREGAQVVRKGPSGCPV